MTLLLILAALAVAGGVGVASFRFGKAHERRQLAKEGYVRLTFGQREDVIEALAEMRVDGLLPAHTEDPDTAIVPAMVSPRPLPPTFAVRTFRTLNDLYAAMEVHGLVVEDVVPHLRQLTKGMRLATALKNMTWHCRQTRFCAEPSTVERLFIELVAARDNPDDLPRIVNFMRDTDARSDSEFRTALMAMDRVPELTYDAILTVRRFCLYGLKSFVDSDGKADAEWDGPAAHEKRVRDTARTVIARRKLND